MSDSGHDAVEPLGSSAAPLRPLSDVWETVRQTVTLETYERGGADRVMRAIDNALALLYQQQAEQAEKLAWFDKRCRWYAKQLDAQQQAEPCVWRKLPMSTVYIQADCMGDNTDGALPLRMLDHGEFNFCPYCGHPLQVQR